MNPQQPPFVPPTPPQEHVPPAPLQQPATSYQQPAPTRKNYRLPILLMVWPIVGILLAILLYAIINTISGGFTPSSAETFAPTNPVVAVLNIILFVLGAASVALGPISFIVGLILLIIRVNQNHAKN